MDLIAEFTLDGFVPVTITIPVGRGPNGLPLGLQMAARPGDDARLLAFALWAEDKLGTVQEAGTA